ncbi:MULTISPECIES: hypothetical protein [unclassified Pseudomonas]|uniref:hypothetical protein n=1 Tax=unclassified Pseudomonas TaxID=196821 RepID=UPI000C885FF8|nr:MULTISPECIES: hypothetical protein [unclassified Pseudomonas]PMZ92295.1 hypothetical protein C1X61_03135 [Pseudomonas sp. FW215-T2]PNA14896.1 hypothetical protein C1X62_05750 [Pseudomonas sp. FW215-R3]PNB39280.1 hypothetical protein C1X63_04285 [Pseudomonas sp. FW305-131]
MQPPKPTLIYLDSCDYSALSKPQLVESEAQQLATLKALKLSGGALFVFSGAHISEMSPLDQQHSKAAVERTNLLVELCGRNTVISFDRLMKAELSRLVARSPQPVDVFDRNGEWFPDMGSLMSPLDEIDVAGKMQQEMDKHALNRKMRRMLKAGTTNKRGNFRSDLEQRFGQMDYSELTDKVPMRPRDFTVLKNYVLGRATREEADKAFLESLRDPSYMAQWFIHHHHQLGSIVEWVRRPARQLLESCEETLTELREQLAELPESDRAAVMKGVSGTHWAKLKKQGMIDIVNRLLKLLLPGASACDDTTAIEEYCPGIFICISTFYDSLQNSFAERPRAMKASDFVDIIHALYVPYVSYFRADKYMCSVIQPLTKRFGTQVVASPAKLIAALGV